MSVSDVNKEGDQGSQMVLIRSKLFSYKTKRDIATLLFFENRIS